MGTIVTFNVMPDLETMGVSPIAAIIQIGACTFDIEGGVGDGFERTVSAIFAYLRR